MITETTNDETNRIADELNRAEKGNAWHGPAIGENLTGVTAEAAAARPIPKAHTIWEIVHHLTAWATEVDERLRRNARALGGEDDWPPVNETDEAAWDQAKAALTAAHARLRATIREFPPARLSDPVPAVPHGEIGSFYFMLHGLAQHDAYHNGQIAILKKALA